MNWRVLFPLPTTCMLLICLSQDRLLVMVTIRYLQASSVSSVWLWSWCDVGISCFFLFGEILIIVHFDGLKLDCHLLSPFSSEVRSFWTVLCHCMPGCWFCDMISFLLQIILSQMKLLFRACHLSRPGTITVQGQ